MPAITNSGANPSLGLNPRTSKRRGALGHTVASAASAEDAPEIANTPDGNGRHKSSELFEWEKTQTYKDTSTQLECLTSVKTGWIPKAAQIRFAMALHTGHNVTCVAATGFGKSLAFQMAAFLMQQRNQQRGETSQQFGVCITPIEALGEDQVNKCAKLGLRALNLTDRAILQESGCISQVFKGEYNLGMFALKHLTFYDN